jgi:hypothetical protein
MSESYEDRLNRMYAGWTDEEVLHAMEAIRESQDSHRLAWEDVWREYARRTFPENVVCKRCGSDNHTELTHETYAS